jgi:hypothetical protein
MTLKEYQAYATKLGIKNSNKMDKLHLIRAIQEKENNFPCFGTADIYCDQLACSFREDCLNKGY